MLNQLLHEINISEDTRRYLTLKQTKPAKFYLLPKIHKPGNPGRPIVAFCGVQTKKISAFVDHHLCPLVQAIPSYIKDTSDFVLKVKSLTNLPSKILLVTPDVSSLYTNIPHQGEIVACITRGTLSPPTMDLAELISAILKKNAFVFEVQHYLQVHGTAMGTRMAPSYANLSMARLKLSATATSSL